MSELKQYSPAADRNAEAILTVLRNLLPPTGLVLELASGTGQHAAHFCAALTTLDWQPSDGNFGALRSIDAWAKDSHCDNLRPALRIDVSDENWPITRADAIYCANMIHISPWESCLGLFSGAQRILPTGGQVFLYGPYRVASVPTAPSNEAFDASLRQRNDSWGLRQLEDVQQAALERGLSWEQTFEMPANNLILTFRKTGN